jgi:hypothetical protein
MSYVIKNEDGETMRIVGRQEEAMTICSLRLGWTFKYVRKSVRKPVYVFEEAPF